jgi:hypothetical protein
MKNVFIINMNLNLIKFLFLDLDEDENEKEQKRCDEKLREIESGFYLLKEMLVMHINHF